MGWHRAGLPMSNVQCKKCPPFAFHDPWPCPCPCPSHTPAMPARHSDVRPRDVSSRLLGGWAAGPAGMRELGVALAAAEAGGLRPEAGKLASSSTSSGYAGREISSPPPAVPAPVPRSRLPLGIGPAVGTALPRGGEGHQGLPCLSACLLVCLSVSIFHASISQCFHASTLPCCHVPVAPLPVVLRPSALSPSPPEPWLFSHLLLSSEQGHTSVLVLVLAALSSFLGPDVSCRPHTVTDATLSTAAELLKGQESR